MKALSRRLARLQARHGPGAVELPAVLFICPGTGEPAAALIVGTGEELEREPGEGLKAFERRAELARRKGGNNCGCSKLSKCGRPDIEKARG